MKKASNIVLGILFGLAPLAVIASIIYALFLDLPGFWAWPIGILLSLLGLYIAYSIFKQVQKDGAWEFSTALTASPDYDQLEPTPGSGVKKVTPEEYVATINYNTEKRPSGAIEVFGDLVEIGDDHTFSLEAANFFEDQNELILSFGMIKVTIKSPKHLLKATSYFQVFKAEEVLVEWVDKAGRNPKPQKWLYRYLKKKVFVESSGSKKGFRAYPNKPAFNFMVF
jgi:hypothetical protein